METIAKVSVQMFHIPLDEVLTDAKHGAHHHFELITATVTLRDGTEGTGYTYTGGRGGHAIAAMIRHDLAPFLIGRQAEAIRPGALADGGRSGKSLPGLLRWY